MRPNPSPRRLRTIAAGAVRVAVGLVILGVGVGAYALLVSTTPETVRVVERDSALTVRTVTVREVEVPRRWSGYGTTRAMRTADVGAEVAGVIAERPEGVDDGARIRAGELIVALEPEEFEQRVALSRRAIESLRSDIEALDVEEDSLQGSLELAVEATRLTRWEIGQLEDARARGAGAAAELNRLQRDLTRFQIEERDIRQRLEVIPSRRQRVLSQIELEGANLRLAELNLRRTRVLAPIDGALQSVDVKLGERVAPGMRIARVVDLTRIEIPVRAPIAAASAISVGDSIEIAVDSPGGLRRLAVIERIAPEADPRTRTITFYAVVDQDPLDASDGLLLPGQFVVARLESRRREALVVAPRGAVVNDRVMIVDDTSRAAPRDVRVQSFIDDQFPEIDPEETQWAVIESGLAPGERVIISNLDELRSGSVVDPVDASQVARRPGEQERPR